MSDSAKTCNVTYNDTAAKGTAALRFVVHWAFNNRDRFWSIDQQLENRTVDPNTAVGRWALDQSKYGSPKYLGFKPDFLSLLLNSGGFSAPDVVKAWADAGWLLSNDPHKRRKYRAFLGTARAWLFAIPADVVNRAHAFVQPQAAPSDSAAPSTVRAVTPPASVSPPAVTSTTTDAAATRTICKLEQQVVALRSQLNDAQAKYRTVSAELVRKNDALGQFLATSGNFSARTPVEAKRALHKGRATAIICLNDWHLEETVDPRTINGYNAFNLDICRQRLARARERIGVLLDFGRQLADIQDAALWAGGDLINGVLHLESLEANSLGRTDAIEFAQNELVNFADAILAAPGITGLRFIANFGNHGRMTQKRHVATEYDNSLEVTAYNNVARELARIHPNVESIISRGYEAIVPIQGHKVRFHHGHAVSYSNGIGGVHTPLMKYIFNARERNPDVAFDVVGHFHQYQEAWRYVMCGCVVGYNAYAQSINAPPQPPTQTLIIVDRDYGKVITLPIFCERNIPEIPESADPVVADAAKSQRL